ncbi:MAG: OmpA family protein [Deltaproteobacteria bacterium]|jgi:peptidoglycan-associated lipoprotein|nr:OmpA family protein [Deltaproteobacteria bacterium]
MNKVFRGFLLTLLVSGLLALAGCGGGEQVKPQPTPGGDAGGSVITHDQAVALLKNNPIYFAFDRYDLDSAARADLQAKADLLNKYTDIKVQISGHCDSRGTDEYNLALGERRARAAYDYLLMLGVKPAQLSTHSYGKMYPAVQGNTEAAWNKNRRDEFNVGY